MGPLSQVIENEDMLKIRREFKRLGDKCYLDNAGAALYPQTLIQNVTQDLMDHVYLNPHTDPYTRDCVDQIRGMILQHYNTDFDEYTVVFTSGTTESLKKVVESFQFSSDNDTKEFGTFTYLRDNHTSVIGLREIALEKNVDIVNISHEDFLKHTEAANAWKNTRSLANSLFVFPAQSNFNGFKYPLEAVESVKRGSLNSYVKEQQCRTKSNWYVMLDAASYVSTSRLDLSVTQPDFVALSFYKIFGYPTGLGALLIKNSSAHVLSRKSYFGGGTVDIVLSSENFHSKRKKISERFEDGTPSFLSILSLKHAFDSLYNLLPKVINSNAMETVANHTFHLAKDLYCQLTSLTHINGTKAAILYMDSAFEDVSKQGGVVTFNILRSDGSYIGYSEFQRMADLFSVSVRTGCFCNSGSCQRHLAISNRDMRRMFRLGHRCGDEVDLIDGRPTGAVRASFGYYNTYDDVDRLVRMIQECYLERAYRAPTSRCDVAKSPPAPDATLPFRRAVTTYREPTSRRDVAKSPPPPDATLPLRRAVTTYREPTSRCDVAKSPPPPDATLPLRRAVTPYATAITLSEIAIYPVKSCGAFKVASSWSIGTTGFYLDREWMVVTAKGVCLTQKHCSRMCAVKPVVDLVGNQLILTYRGKPNISLPLDDTESVKAQNLTFCQSKVCADVVQGRDCGDAAAAWLSDAMGLPGLRLVRQAGSDQRRTKSKSKSLSLSNQAQFLLVSRATVRWLHRHLADTALADSVDALADRFRSNLVVDTQDELLENEWKRLVIGTHEFKVESHCNRCQMVCIDQKTGDKTVEPLRTISKLFDGKLRFGVYLSYVGTLEESNNTQLKINSSCVAYNNDEDFKFQKSLFKSPDEIHF